MQVKGTYSEGKMYRGNGVWVKVMANQATTRASRLSIAFGKEGNVSAYEVHSAEATTTKEFLACRRRLDVQARDHVAAFA